LGNPHQDTAMLYIIGLGLGDEKDITLRGLEAVRSCSKLFLEAYTSILCVGKEKLEEFYGKEITIADRHLVESEAESIYGSALVEDVALLVVGDPVCATTHTDIMLRALEIGAKVEVIHNASIMGAAGCCGLQLYNFGQTVSLPFFEGEWRPGSFHPKVAYNRQGAMHTLCLLDIKVKEPDFVAMAKGRTVFQPPRFMTVNVALRQLLEIEEGLAAAGEGGAYSRDTLCVGMARLGQADRTIVAGTMGELLDVDFGAPLHSLVICAEDTHDLELEMLKQFWVGADTKRLEE